MGEPITITKYPFSDDTDFEPPIAKWPSGEYVALPRADYDDLQDELGQLRICKAASKPEIEGLLAENERLKARMGEKCPFASKETIILEKYVGWLHKLLDD
jgi:hypothetical protein